MPQKHIPYDPDKIIRMTLYEYKRGRNHAKHKVTGRFTEFGIPMKYLANASAYHEQVPLSFSTWMTWERNENGEIEFVSVRDEQGFAPRSNVNTNIFRSHVTSAGVGGPIAGDRQFRGGALNRNPFPGFFGSHTSVKPSKQYYPMEGPYCGFDAFDNTLQWTISGYLEQGQDPREHVDEPLSLGRAFAYPSGSEAYTQIVLCKDHLPLGIGTGFCRAGRSLNDYVKYRISFDSSTLCSAPDLLGAFDAFLRKYASAQE
ncbi:MAG: hypothetical protein AAGC81_18635 [Pseudomonadota bacterium]